MAQTKQYILISREGIFKSPSIKDLSPPEPAPLFRKPMAALGGRAVARPQIAKGREIRLLDSIVDGPKLVEMDEVVAREVNRSSQDRLVPIVRYPKPFTKTPVSGGRLSGSYALSASRPRPHIPVASGKGKARLSDVTIQVVKKTGKGKSTKGTGLMVSAFTNFSALEGHEKTTDDSGTVVLQLSGKNIERLYCYPPDGYWGAFRQNIPAESIILLELTPVSVEFKDCIRRCYGKPRFRSTTGVLVGVIDSGVGPHDDLNLDGGCNTVSGEAEEDYQDADFHGTHVAGLIGSRGILYPNLRGLAPGVRIRSYRVFGQFASDAINFDLVKAMVIAEHDRCDILNLSIEDAPNDDILRQTVIDARNHGMLVVVAAGNDRRKAVNYPAAYPGATAVSAMGCEGTFPPGALEEAEVSRPPHSTTDPKEFIAAFSNKGEKISVTGFGVAVLSTLPGNLYGICSGTSMAAPVVTGAAANLLSQHPEIYKMPRNRARSDAIEKLLLDRCISRGFGAKFEGRGMPDPAEVCL